MEFVIETSIYEIRVDSKQIIFGREKRTSIQVIERFRVGIEIIIYGRQNSSLRQEFVRFEISHRINERG